MNSKIIKLNNLIKWLLVATVFCTASVAWAGPLDRGEMQPRHNPAANSMIRVPGVLGQSERYALETLQRAGLNVNAKYIRQSTEKYAGRNGMVVRQIPSAGGIAMLGSSVTITVYKVEGEPIDESGGGDYGGSDDGGYGGSGDGGYGDSGGGGYGDSGGGGYGDSGDGGYGGSGGGGYGGSGGGGYGDSGGSAGGGAAGDGGGGSGDDTDTGGPVPDDDSSGPDWGSPGPGSGGGSAP